VLGTGDAITDLWTIRTDQRPLSADRVTRGTTWYGVPTISHDGRTLFYFRGDALGDNVYRLDLGTGVEEALTEYRGPGGNAVRLAVDGSRLLYNYRAGTQVRVGMVEFPSQRVSGADARIQGGFVEPVGTQGLLGLEQNSNRLVLADSLNGTWRRVPVADSINPFSFAVAPYNLSILAAVEVPDGLAVGLLRLDRGNFQTLAPLTDDEPSPGLSWSADGAIHVARWLREDRLPSLWRLSGAGRLERWAELPVACQPTSVVVSLRSDMATCSTDDFRTDIWLYDVPGVRR
jgi:hypothetical protein